jgi:hypothetical protein
MQVFISFSGERSLAYAKIVKEWLKKINYKLNIKTSQDLKPGTGWFDALSGELKKSDFGIICLTPENLNAGWPLFEAGAISVSVDPKQVVPLLFGLDAAELPHPLANLQAVIANVDGFRRLISSINQAKLPRLSKDELTRRFDDCLPKFLEELESSAQKFPRGKISHQESPAVQAPKPRNTRDSSGGIKPLSEFLQSETRFPGEAYAILLLRNNIRLDRDDGKIAVTIDRRQVKDVIYSNAGKAAIYAKYFHENKKILEDLDEEVQRYLLGQNFTPKHLVQDKDKRGSWLIPLREKGFPLRWASGGVLSIVTYRKRKYVPVFFRDIRPYGWNISLGSSERQFKADDKTVQEGVVNDEWDDPWAIIRREFLEESLVLNGKPTDENLAFKRFRANVPISTRREERYAERHAIKRMEEDGLDIQRGQVAIPLTATFSTDTNVRLTVVKDSKNKRCIDDVLVCFSFLDLGIEVVKVAEYRLNDEDTMLDGEIHPGKASGESELVRMPIALISCKYLAQQFGDSQDFGKWYRYTEGPAPSIWVDAPPGKDDAILFEYDIEQRMMVVQGKQRKKPASEWLQSRCLGWYDCFGDHFVNRDGSIDRGNLSALFVPATAKILNMYFCLPGMCERYK